jgi:hypothetical protein
LGNDWRPEPVNSQAIWNDFQNPTNEQPSSCWFACPNECQLQFALADNREAAEAAKQINEIFSKPLRLSFGRRISLFRVRGREAWLEVRRLHPPKGKLAFITSDLQHAGNSLVAGRSPVPPVGTNRVDSAAITLPPDAVLNLTGEIEGKDTNSPAFSLSLTNSPNEPGIYWLTWRPGSSSNPKDDGWEIYIHDARTTQQLYHFASRQEAQFRWRADWSYESTTAEPGEALEKVLLISDGMTRPGNSKIPYALLRLKMIMQPRPVTER